MILTRVDNFFYNTEDVAGLAQFHSKSLGMPIRREQTESPGLMWAEINVGGMELSFRLSGGTPKAHPELESNFLELSAGEGATISFEVHDMESVRSELSSRGVKFYGDVISCSDGHEIISIFEDPFGRPVQLYEPRFSSFTEAVSLAARASAVESVSSGSPSRKVQIGSNLRDVRDMAMSISFYVDDLQLAKNFYGDILELPLYQDTKDRLSFLLDGTIIEFRKFNENITPLEKVSQLSSNQGGVVAIEVRKLDLAREMLTARNATLLPQLTEPLESARGGSRSAFRDIDGNPLELWERSPDF
jgi:catechol 2,3-dioxygenase-like lactoylglutathione lyase family enzyme